MYTLVNKMEQVWHSFIKRWKTNKAREPENFYAALDTFMDEVHGDLLLTHRSVYITYFKYITRYIMFVAYDHVNAGNLTREYVID